jgi:hypothetical protein
MTCPVRAVFLRRRMSCFACIPALRQSSGKDKLWPTVVMCRQESRLLPAPSLPVVRVSEAEMGC